jgi:hypothetical protein
VSGRLLGWVNEEALVISALKLRLNPAYKVVTDLPNPVDPALPLVQVIASTGSLDQETTVVGRVDVYCLAATRAAMWALSGETYTAMGSLAGVEVNGQLIDMVRALQRPSFLAWSPTVPRSIAVYELQYRPRTV